MKGTYKTGRNTKEGRKGGIWKGVACENVGMDGGIKRVLDKVQERKKGNIQKKGRSRKVRGRREEERRKT